MYKARTWQDEKICLILVPIWRLRGLKTFNDEDTISAVGGSDIFQDTFATSLHLLIFSSSVFAAQRFFNPKTKKILCYP